MAAASSKHTLSSMGNIDSCLERPSSPGGTLQICTISLCLFPFLFHFGEKCLLSVFIPSVSTSCAESGNSNIWGNCTQQAVLKGCDTHQVTNYSARNGGCCSPCADDNNLLLHNCTVLFPQSSGWHTKWRVFSLWVRSQFLLPFSCLFTKCCISSVLKKRMTCSFLWWSLCGIYDCSS